MNSVLDPQLIEAYRRTRYRVTGGCKPFDLRVDEASRELLGLYKGLGVLDAAFLTAWNPQGKCVSREDNERAQAALCAELDRRQLFCLGGRGEAADGSWCEDGVLVLGLSQADAMRLGCDHRQNALVWAGPDAVPRLVLLR